MKKEIRELEDLMIDICVDSCFTLNEKIHLLKLLQKTYKKLLTYSK